MRNIQSIILLTAVMVIAIVTSCGNLNNKNNADNNLTALLDSINGVLPIEMEDYGTIDSVYYDSGGNTAVFNVVAEEKGTDTEIMYHGGPRSKKLLLYQLSSNSTVLSIYKGLAQKEVTVRTVFISPNGKNYGQVELMPEEITAIMPAAAKPQKEIKEDSITMKRDSLDTLIDSINASLPDTIDTKTLLTTVLVENNYLVYNYVFDESKGTTMDKLKGEMSRKKALAESEMRKSSPSQQKLMQLCVDNGLGIKHRYVGRSTKQTKDFSFSAVDLSKITGHALPAGYEAIKERIKPKPKPQKEVYEEGIY